jgi:hypothetical protein
MVLMIRAGSGIARAWKNRVIARAANGFNQLLGRGQRRIEDDAGAVSHQIHVRRFNAGSCAQRFFYVMLAGGARHP